MAKRERDGDATALAETPVSTEDLERRADELALAAASGSDAASAELEAVELEIGRRQTAEQRSVRAVRAKQRQDAANVAALRRAERQAAYAKLQAQHVEVVASAARVEAIAAALKTELEFFHAASLAKHTLADRLGVTSDLFRDRKMLAFFLSETAGIGHQLMGYREFRNAFCRQPDGSLLPARLLVRDVPPLAEEA